MKSEIGFLEKSNARLLASYLMQESNVKHTEIHILCNKISWKNIPFNGCKTHHKLIDHSLWLAIIIVFYLRVQLPFFGPYFPIFVLHTGKYGSGKSPYLHIKSPY